MKVFAAILLATGAVVLSAASSPAGAAAKHATHAAGFNCISSCAAYESTINQYFTDVATDSANAVTTNVYSVLPQYSIPNTTTPFATTFDAGTNTYNDTNPYPPAKCHDGFDKYCVTDKQIQAEITNVIAAHNWPTHTTTALYFIFTPANVGVCLKGGKASNGIPCTTNLFCAYHDNAGQRFIYAVEPDDAAVFEDGCVGSFPQSPAGNNADPTINTISHEQFEAITDPYGTAWTSDDPEAYMGQPNYFFGSEIGDLCLYNFGNPLGTTAGGQDYNQVINTHDYYLQQEYSNADGGCVQYAGGTPTNFSPGNLYYSGVGPLVNHGGPVMASNTIYAIYWVPAAPANTAIPKIAGKAEVGRKLKAFPGVWSNSPTLAYQWLRCSAAGTSCKRIKKATASSYRLVPADAGHRMKIRVTATNIVGHRNATSVPTRKVKP